MQQTAVSDVTSVLKQLSGGSLMWDALIRLGQRLVLQGAYYCDRPTATGLAVVSLFNKGETLLTPSSSRACRWQREVNWYLERATNPGPAAARHGPDHRSAALQKGIRETLTSCVYGHKPCLLKWKYGYPHALLATMFSTPNARA